MCQKILKPRSRVGGRRGTRRLARLLPPPPQTERADFPHSAFLPTSRQRLWALPSRSDCWPIRAHAIVEKDPDHPRDPQPAPSIPPEAPTLPVPQPVPPQRDFDPVADKRETPTGLAHRKVGDPTAQDGVDALHHPTDRLRPVPIENIPERSQQRRALRALRRITAAATGPIGSAPVGSRTRETRTTPPCAGPPPGSSPRSPPP